MSTAFNQTSMESKRKRCGVEGRWQRAYFTRIWNATLRFSVPLYPTYGTRNRYIDTVGAFLTMKVRETSNGITIERNHTDL